MIKSQITACIDGSVISNAVCDTATWASRVLDAPLTFLHVLEKIHAPAREDLSGAIGLGSREHLLDELTALDAKRAKVATEHGKHLLSDAQQRAEAAGATTVRVEQRHDQLVSALLTLEEVTRLYVIGRLGAGHDITQHVIGSHIESVVRAVQTPVLVTNGQFTEPSNFMLAYDGSDTANKAIERVANSPLLLNLPGHVVMVGNNTEENQSRLDRACALLTKQGHNIQKHLIQGNIVDSLLDFQKQFDIEMKVMGAYGHSRIREFILGSHTTKILASSTTPVLILR